jgi:predicted Mrr-cat superfamily restriction endonuclease
VIDQIAGIIIGLQLVPIVFPCNRKHEIANHREANNEKHIAKILQKENGKNTIKDKGQLDAKVQAIYIDKTGKDRIKYKIAKQRSVIFVE